ncbi:hypothetical protein O181_102453 [Austropuccinia psidii MF-1]|uniref:Uncharacterized protein n=1 Tax=Austropuccinia psidii MF-1 TaxID=1389203 RepID=A0A9Q3JIG0_9BASI|nr:hypothetical protein [Austropuccinia psidii MF-1]
MPIQYSPPAGQTRSQARAQAVLTPTPRAPPDSNPAVLQLRAQNGRSSTIQEGPGEDGEEEEENSVEEEESDAQYTQPVSHQSEPPLWAIMQKMTEIMDNIQADSSSDPSRPPAFKTSSMKAP